MHLPYFFSIIIQISVIGHIHQQMIIIDIYVYSYLDSGVDIEITSV